MIYAGLVLSQSWSAVWYITYVTALMSHLEQVGEGYNKVSLEKIAEFLRQTHCELSICLCVTAQILLFARAAYSILKIRMVASLF